jgi:hypothetical protein
MPTQDELARLYDKAKTYQSECRFLLRRWDIHLTEFIRLTCAFPWASETRGSEAASIDLEMALRGWFPQSRDLYHRALPVRSVK